MLCCPIRNKPRQLGPAPAGQPCARPHRPQMTAAPFAGIHVDRAVPPGALRRRGRSGVNVHGRQVSEPGVNRATVESLTHKDRRLIVISMMLPVFLGSIDQSILATSLPTIGRALGDVHNLPWLITSFLIASTALTPLYGKFADIHGRRAALLIALGVYLAG